MIEQDTKDPKELFTQEHPHPSGAYWDPLEQKWKGYKATKGFAPPWNPFNPENRKKRVTINEKKFLMVLSQTGNMNESFRAVYKVTAFSDKRMENARISALANQVLERIRRKAPELVRAYTFDDVNPDWIKKEYRKLYDNPHGTISEKRAILADMAKINAMFTEHLITDQKIREIVDPVYAETADDMPTQLDERKSRYQIDEERIATA